MEQLKVISDSTAPGTLVLVVGVEGWEIFMGELISLDGHRATIRGRDGVEHEHFAYAVHICPEAPRG